MKVSSNVRMALALGVIGALGLGRGNAQTFLQGSVQPSTNSIQLGGSVTYTIGLTNFSQELAPARDGDQHLLFSRDERGL